MKKDSVIKYIDKKVKEHGSLLEKKIEFDSIEMWNLFPDEVIEVMYNYFDNRMWLKTDGKNNYMFYIILKDEENLDCLVKAKRRNS